MTQSSFIDEMKWRGMFFDATPEVESYLTPGAKGYIGFDPTSDSLTIGNFVQIMILTLYQRHGHQPIVLMGGATGRIGDPSGKDAERTLKSIEEIESNVKGQTNLLKKLIDFDHPENPAILVNNYDWYRDLNVLDFLRHIGKTLTVNYMMSKESVKKRIETGISFTEFSYQLLQGYDFQRLFEDHDCRLQMGGSDQWGNITSGTEFIRRNSGGRAYGVTTPLLTKSDGSKFGKSESGAIWLSADKTSPYQFYQYWLNVSDADLEKLIKYFSLKTREEMQAMIDMIEDDPRQVKTQLADELTARVHNTQALNQAKKVSEIIFNKKLDHGALIQMEPEVLDMVSKEIPSFVLEDLNQDKYHALSELCTEHTDILNSKGELRRAIKNNAISVNKIKISDPDHAVENSAFIHNKYLFLENGKKNKYLLIRG